MANIQMTEIQKDYIRKEYPFKSNDEISKALNLSIRKIQCWAFNNNIKKDISYKVVKIKKIKPKIIIDKNNKLQCQICGKLNKDLKGLGVHLSKIHDIINKEKYYLEFIGEKEYCKICKKDAKFISIVQKYKEFCGSKECHKKSIASCTVEFYMYKYNLSYDNALIKYNESIEKRSTIIKNSMNNAYKDNNEFFKNRSKSCKEYWLTRGYSEEYAVLETNKRHKLMNNGLIKDKKNNPDKYSNINTSQIAYWLAKGLSQEEAELKLRERQQTFTKEKCIEKYGKEDGLIKWQERQDKWQNTMNSKSDEEKKEINFKKLNSNSYHSKISQELFWNIYNNASIEKDKNYYFKELNDEYFLSKGNNYFLYDFIDINNKKCIEFNGTFWHCKPGVYNEDYYHNIRKLYAKDIWSKDKIKNDILLEKGFELLIVWEDEYRKNKNIILNKCIKFLNN